MLAATTLGAVAQDGKAAAEGDTGTGGPDFDEHAVAVREPWVDRSGHWRLMGSPYTFHFSPDPEHERVYMVGLERQRADGWVWGGTYFSNSFGQPTVYVYVGEKVIGISSRWQPLFFQWTAGVMYGYKDPYEHKVPFNVNGFSPGATASLGWQFTPAFSMQAIALGTAAVMLQLAYDFR